MEVLFTVLRLILFFVSNLGFWEYFRRKSNMNVFFVPGFTISLQITLLFCAGILNCLKIVALGMFIVGIFLSIYYLYKDFKGVVHAYSNGGYVFYLFSICLIMLACSGKVFTQYDNFSHWALVVKSMLLNDRFPNFEDSLIVFREYPLGSVSYVYYFSKIVSNMEAVQMASQGIMMLGFILPVFKYVKQNVIASGVFFLVFVNYIFCYNIFITNLLVDTLLPLAGMSMLFFIYTECLNFDKETGGGVSVLYAIPFLCAIIQIKNSGIYFLLLACILLICTIKRNKSDIRSKIYTILAPFASLYLWHVHCGYVFSDGAVSKHAMTVQNYKEVFAQKTGEDISAILTSVIKFSVDFNVKELRHIILFIILVGLFSIVVDNKVTIKYIKMILLSTISYIIYMAGMACMYVFSMPLGEAMNLAGIDRYRKTFFIAIYYLLVLFLLKMISRMQHVRKRWGYIIGIYFALCILWKGESNKSFPTIFNCPEDSRRHLVEKVIKDYDVPVGASFSICTPTVRDAGYMWYLVRYLLWNDNGASRVITEESQLDTYAENYDYILIYDQENPHIKEWIKVNYPEQEGNPVIVTAR